MKKVLLFFMLALFCGTAAWAQHAQKVSESEVTPKHVKDFQQQQKKATQVTWYKLSDDTYRVDFRDKDGDNASILFGNKGSETYYYIPENCYPAFVRDTVEHNANFKGFSIDKLYVRKVKNNVTYQARIVKKSGFLWWKKETAAKLVNFEVGGKFIDAIDYE